MKINYFYCFSYLFLVNSISIIKIILIFFTNHNELIIFVTWPIKVHFRYYLILFIYFIITVFNHFFNQIISLKNFIFIY